MTTIPPLVIGDASNRLELVPALLNLVAGSFAYMEGRVDPPSSVRLLNPETLAEKMRSETVLIARSDAGIVGCVFLQERPPALYAGKLAVAAEHRGKGIARKLLEAAEMAARTRGLTALELQTRVELTENHAVFSRLGFIETGRSAHAGYDRATSITLRKQL